MRKYENFSAVILAGGESSRMGGRDKSQLIVGERTILEKSIESLKKVFSEIIIATNEKRDYAFPGVEVIRDEFKGCGPLAGIYSGLNCLRNKAGFFTACDMPFLHIGLIEILLDSFESRGCEAVVPRYGGRIEPLWAVYKKELKESLREFLLNSESYSVKVFLKNVNVYYLDLEKGWDFGNIFRNINTPEDLAEAIKHEGKI